MSIFTPEVQVLTEQYINNKPINYGTWTNFMFQINDAISTNPDKILIIGKGKGVVDNYLQSVGNFKCYSMDIDESLSPDFVCGLPDLNDEIKTQKFDTIICAHVLEHIPFEYFEKSLENLSKICKYLIVQLPPSSLQFRLNIGINPYLFNLNLNLNIPLLFWKEYKFNGEHYWQPCRKGTSMRKIKQIMSKNFLLEKSYQNPYNHYSYHFILKSKNV